MFSLLNLGLPKLVLQSNKIEHNSPIVQRTMGEMVLSMPSMIQHPALLRTVDIGHEKSEGCTLPRGRIRK
jgi:hypothetical protein